MVKQALSQNTGKNFVYQLMVHKIFFQGRHKDRNEFKSHVISSAVRKGIGQSFDLNIARVSKNSKGGVDVYSIRTQDSWGHEWPQIERQPN